MTVHTKRRPGGFLKSSIAIGLVGLLSSVANGATQDVSEEPKPPAGHVEKTCDLILSVEQAAAIQSEVSAAVAAIPKDAPNAVELMTAAATKAIAAHAAVSDRCPCSDNVLAFVASTLVQQAALAGFSDSTQKLVLMNLKQQAVANLHYDQVCVASALGDDTGQSDATASTSSDDPAFPGFPDTAGQSSFLSDVPQASGN